MTQLSVFAVAAALVTLLGGCAFLHHAQVGDIDDRSKGAPFDIKVSETGISLDEAAAVAGAFASKADRGNLQQIRDFVSLFQQGPHTGNGVFNDKYAEDLVDLLYKKCPSGRISGLLAIRESTKYPVISGEIIHLTGFCH